MGKVILGKIYVGDNENVIFTIEDGVSSIFLIDDNCNYKLLVDDKDANKKLNFSEHHQITGIFRMRNGCHKTIYFTDNYNPPRYLDISNVNDFKEIIQSVPRIEYGALDVDKMLLQKTYDIIPALHVEISNAGSLLSGSYNLSVRYVDADLNASEWINSTEPIMIWQDNTMNYSTTRVSSNEDNDFRKYGPTNKSIRVWCDNSKLDHSYNYIQFALIGATSGAGFVSDVIYSNLIELDFGRDTHGRYNATPLTYLFDGSSKGYEGNIDDIIFQAPLFDKVKAIEQADNKLILGNITETDVDWGHLQKYASRITADCIVKEIDTIDYEESHKNPMCLFNGGVGYQQGEIYSFGIVYVLENGAKSPVYHIPGRKKREDTNTPLLPYSNGRIPMEENNECANKTYDATMLSSDGLSYWGYDCNGNPLAGERVRHHRFPIDSKCIDTESNSKIEVERRFIAHYNLVVGVLRGRAIKPRFRNNFDTIRVKYVVNTNEYKPNNAVDELISQEEVELNIDYKVKNFWQSLYKKQDVSVSEHDQKMFAWGDISQTAARVKWYPNRMPFEDGINDGFVRNPDGNYNGMCGNPKKGWFPRYVEYGVRAEDNTTDKESYLKKNRQHRYIDVYSIDISDGRYVSFQCIQEYPQFRETENNINSRPIFLTTGSVIVWDKYGKATLTDEHKLLIQDIMDEIDDSFFLNKVEALPRTRVRQGFRRDVGLKNGRRVRLVKNPGCNWTDLEEQGQDAVSFYGSNKTAAIVNSVLGFHIEPRIEIVETYKQTDKRYVYGIEFGGIEKPNEKYLNGHRVIGYHIVQNERTEEDATILDSAVLFPLYKEKDDDDNRETIISAGRLFATDGIIESGFTADYSTITNAKHIYDQFSCIPMASLYDNPSQPRFIKPSLVRKHLFRDGVGIIYPEFKFNKIEYYDFKFRLKGYFRKHNLERRSVDFDEAWIVQDAQSGTSFNKKINAARDMDNNGTDLHIYHLNDVVYFDPISKEEKDANTYFSVKKEDIHYLAPSSEIFKDWESGHNFTKRTIYNASGDNTMGFLFNLKDDNGRDINCRDLFTEDNMRINKYPYGYLVREKEDYYPDFFERPYYDVSGFRDKFDSTNTLIRRTCEVFNGDCFISTIKYTNSLYYNLKLKKRNKAATWAMYLAGSLMVAGGIVASVYTKGAVGPQLIGPAVSLIQNGINIDLAYKNGDKFIKSEGRKTLVDGFAKQVLDKESLDDEIQWLCESIDGLSFESRINMNWRLGLTTDGLSDYLNPRSNYNPTGLRDYFFKKFTYSDRERNDGKMYRGYAAAEVYQINKDFQRRNKEKAYYCLPITYQACSKCKNHRGKRIVYSMDSYAEERVDNYRVFAPNNYTDINGDTGDIVHIYFNGADSFYIFAKEGLWVLKPTMQQQVSADFTIRFVGDGNYFQTPPVLIYNEDVNISYGSNHKNSFCNTPKGIFWFSEHDNAVYTIKDKEGVIDIFKSGGMGKFFEREGRIVNDAEYYNQFRCEYPFKDNPSHELGTGYILGWDNKYERLLITKKDNLVDFSEECFIDSNEIMKPILRRIISQYEDEGKKNISYYWDQEKCCYVLDYDTQSDFLIDVSTSTESVHRDIVNDFVINIIPSIDVYTTNVVIDSFVEVLDRIKRVSSNTNNIYILEDTPSTHGFITSNSDCCRVIDVVNFNTAYEEIKKIGLNKVSRVVYITTTPDVTNNDRLADICFEYNKYNIPIDIYPIVSIEKESLPFSTFEEMLNYYGVTADTIENLLIDDEYIQCLEKVDLTKPKEEINSNLNEYKEMLADLYSDIQEAFEETKDEEVTKDTFDSIIELLTNGNTYNYWNKIANSYNFDIADDYSNMSLNLIAFKGISDEFDLLAYRSLQGGYYDVDASEYDKLNEAIKTSDLTISKSLSSIFGDSTIIDKCSEIFKVLYDKYSKECVPPIKNKLGQTNKEVIKGLVEQFSFNNNSNICPSFPNISTNIEHNKIIGNKVNENIFFHSTFMIRNEQQGIRTDFMLNPNVLQSTSRSTITHGEINGTHKLCKWQEHREYIYSGGLEEEDNYVENVSNKVADNSFTISYKPDAGFVSFHSYLPHIYIYTPNNLYTWRNDGGTCSIYKHNIKGDYQRFYGERYPFVLEFVDGNSSSSYGNVISENITMLLKSSRYDAITGDFTDVNNVFFTAAYFYNSRQFSPLKRLYIKDKNNENYFRDYFQLQSNEIAVENRDSYWSINDIRDERTIYNIPIHTYNKIDRDAFMANNNFKGWIDKSPNNICTSKSWLEEEPFKDNYMCQRFFYVQKESDVDVKISVYLKSTNQVLIQQNNIEKNG